MNYFKWTDSSLTSDCSSLEAMAYRFEEASKLLRKMAKEGFELHKKENEKFITHENQKVFDAWGFISEEPAFKQLTLISQKEI